MEEETRHPLKTTSVKPSAMIHLQCHAEIQQSCVAFQWFLFPPPSKPHPKRVCVRGAERSGAAHQNASLLTIPSLIPLLAACSEPLDHDSDRLLNSFKLPTTKLPLTQDCCTTEAEKRNPTPPTPPTHPPSPQTKAGFLKRSLKPQILEALMTGRMKQHQKSHLSHNYRSGHDDVSPKIHGMEKESVCVVWGPRN